jgi:hypothetical protein
VHKDILLWGKTGPVPPSLLRAPLVDSLQCCAVFLCQFAECQGIHFVNKAGPSGWGSWGAADFDKVGIEEEEEDM